MRTKGAYTNACLKRFEEAKIHAFELLSETCDKFLKNVRSDRVVINNFGLSDSPGTLEINYNLKKDGITSLVEGGALHEGHWIRRPVEVVKGDDYCLEHQIESIDFLKIDVEGAENLVLDGFSEMLKANRISAIQFEYGMISIYSKFLLNDFWKLSGSHGFVIEPVMPRGIAFKAYDARDENFQGPPNFLAVHSSRPALIDAVKLRR